jgi:hypothetical protein
MTYAFDMSVASHQYHVQRLITGRLALEWWGRHAVAHGR